MAPHHYRHQIIRWNGSAYQSPRYQLQVVALNQFGQPLHKAQWNFATFKGLLTFLKTYFPESDRLNSAATQPIQFRIASALSEL